VDALLAVGKGSNPLLVVEGGSPTLAVDGSPACLSHAMASASGGLFRSAVVEFTWSNLAPTLSEVWIAVDERDGAQLGHAEGSNAPLRVVLTGSEFPLRPSVELAGRLGGTGLFVGFHGTFTFSLFETPAPPAGYTALR
jgi:hypothetical protein